MLSHFVRFMRRMFMAVGLICILSGLVVAQSTTDGAIAGTVFDTNGAVVPKVQVSIRNNGTNAEQSAVSDDSGYFRAVKLQPGSYTLSIDHKGFAPYKAEQVIVQVGAVTEISPHLKVAGATETIDVTAEAPQINYTSPDFAPSFNQTAISNLPINGGRWSSFAILTPGVVSDSSGFGLLSFRGMSTLLNNNTVDGADNNQAFFSEERGRTRVGYSTPMAAVDEFQVNTSNYSSEYGRSAGGVINTVTKSGTNAIHGEAYYYRRDNDFGAANKFTVIQVPTSTPGVFTPVNFKPTDKRDRWGFGIGGPLMKDKLFWFVAYDGYHRNFPGTGVASNPNAFFGTPSPATITAFAQHLNGLASTTAPTAGQIAAASTTYANDLTAMNTMLGPVPRTGDQDIIYPKVDWQINPKHRLSVAVNRMRWWSPAGIQTQATNTLGIASFGNDYVKDTWGVAKFDSFISTNLSNQVRVQYGRDFEFEFGQTPTPYEQANLMDTPTFTNPLGLPPSVSITNGFSFGLPTFLQRPAFPDEKRTQVADTVTWIRGKHTLKFGFDFSHVHDNSQNLRTQFGSYSYSSLLNYFSDLNVPHGCATSASATPTLACYSSFSQAFGPIGFEFDTNDIAFFMQDDWKIHQRLSLSLGVRYERELLPQPFSSQPDLRNPNLPQSSFMPDDQNNIGPRVGFAWDVFGRGKTVLRGGYGFYYGRIINSTIFNALTNTGMPGGQNSLTFTPTTTVPVAAPVFPVVFSSLPAGAGRNVTFFDSNFQNPQIREADLTLEHDLGWGTVISASYLGSFGRQLPNFVDVNIAPSTATVTYQVVNGGPIASPTYTTTKYTARSNPLFGSMTDITSRTISNYNALVVQVNHRMSHHVQFNASYTWAHALDNGVNGTTFSDTNDQLDPFNPNKDYGNSSFNVGRRFVTSAVVESPWHHSGLLKYFADDWQIAPIYQIQTGLPYSANVAGSAPGGISGINGSGGANRLDIGRNTFNFPNTWIADFRISKQFSATERIKVELSTDFFNLANKQNVTGLNMTAYIIQSSGSVTTPTGSVTCGNGVGVNPLPCLNFNNAGPTPTSGPAFAPLFQSITNSNSNFIYSPRQIQFGMRVKF
jgi:hypothetical protein